MFIPAPILIREIPEKWTAGPDIRIVIICGLLVVIRPVRKEVRLFIRAVARLLTAATVVARPVTAVIEIVVIEPLMRPDALVAPELVTMVAAARAFVVRHVRNLKNQLIPVKV